MDFQDYDNDGWEDVFLTALAGETFPLFHNDGRREFTEKTTGAGLAMSTAKLSGWCATFVDVNNDGWKDIFTANSHANDRVSESSGWNQPNGLWLNDRRGRFEDVAKEAGLAGSEAAHRGCGVADFDGDGRLDIAVLVLGANAELWHNETVGPNRWLTVRLVGGKAIATAPAHASVSQVRTMTTGNWLRIFFGTRGAFRLGPTQSFGSKALLVRQVVDGVKSNQVIEIKEQSGYWRWPLAAGEKRNKSWKPKQGQRPKAKARSYFGGVIVAVRRRAPLGVARWSCLS